MKDFGHATKEPQVCPYCMTVIETQEGKCDCGCTWEDEKYSVTTSYWFLRLFDRNLPAFPSLGSKVKMKDVMLLRPEDVLFIFEHHGEDSYLCMYSPIYAAHYASLSGPEKCA